MRQQTIVMFSNTDWYLYNFRRSLARKYQNQGFHVVLLSPGEFYGQKLIDDGFDWQHIKLESKSMNPLKELKVLLQIWKILNKFRPILIHNFTIKPALYGSLVARVLGRLRNSKNGRIQILNSITGLGHVFTAPGLKAKLIRGFVKMLYRFILSNKSIRVIFQNEEDQHIFEKNHLVTQEQSKLVRGSGVNCLQFKPGRERRKVQRVRILFASRLIREKGIIELLAATKQLYSDKVNCELVIAGEIYEGNPSSLNEDEVQQISEYKWVRYLGHVSDMPKQIAQSDIVVLPSYREGTPKILLEAAACGKPIIATDIAGCRGVVQHGVNGLLVPVRDVEALAEAIRVLVADKELRKSYGRNSREIVIANFEESIVNEKTLDIARELNLVCSIL